MKKLIALILAAVLLAAFAVPQALAVETQDIYSDVLIDEWYAKAVNIMSSEGLLEGYGGMYRPDAPMKRSEFVMVLFRLAGAGEAEYTEGSFCDVDINAWYGKAVEWAAREDLVNGYSAKVFAPDDYITREQMCVIMNRYIEKAEISLNDAAEKTFTDRDEISVWAVDAVNACARWGVISGMPDGSFCPHGELTRAQVAQVLYNFYLLLPDSEYGEINDSQYAPLFSSYYYDSFEVMYSGLVELSDEEVNGIKSIERGYFLDTDRKTYVTDAEYKNGIFGNMLNTVREEQGVLYPHINGEPVSLNEQAEYSITVSPTGAFRKPWISYFTDEGYSVEIMRYDASLADGAEKNGAAWLMKTLGSDELNVDNWQAKKEAAVAAGNADAQYMEVYEKEYTVSGAKVKTLVIDYTANPESPTLTVYLVDGDALVRVFGRPDTVEQAVTHLSFELVGIAQ